MSFETKDYLSLGLSGVALATTVIWNILNRAHTDRTARDIRGETFQLEEWKDKRAEVKRALLALEEQFTNLHMLATIDATARELRAKASDIGREMTKAHLTLQNELERVGPEWPMFAYGMQEKREYDWDIIHSDLAEISALDQVEDIRARLRAIRPHATSISNCVMTEVRIKTAEYDPVKF
jgi:hypothetical protein